MTSSRPKAAREVNARILYWGIPGADASANLRRIHGKLRADHRGELRRVPTRLDPTVSYEVLPIELGVVNGVQTRLQIIAVPPAPEHEPTRKQLLDRVDGLVLIVDCQRERIQENLACFRELRESLKAYGRSLSDLPVVVQYNKPDHGDPGVAEHLHRALDLKDVAVFETVATEGSGALQALTTISKRVVRVLREQGPGASPEPPARAAGQAPPEARAAPIPQAEAMDATVLPKGPSVAPSSPTTPTTPTTPTGAREPTAAAQGEATPTTSAGVAQGLLEPEPAPKPAPLRDPAEAEITLPARATEPESTPLDIEPEPEETAPAPSPRASDVIENAILAEDEQVDRDVASTAFEAQTLLDQPWDQIPDHMKSPGEARIGADLRIVSVGNTTRTGDRAVRVPLVLGNAEGESVTVVLSIQLDPLVDGEET